MDKYERNKMGTIYFLKCSSSCYLQFTRLNLILMFMLVHDCLCLCLCLCLFMFMLVSSCKQALTADTSLNQAYHTD